MLSQKTDRNLTLKKDSWRNIRYKYNELEKKIEEEELGVFIQYPIRWHGPSRYTKAKD